MLEISTTEGLPTPEEMTKRIARWRLENQTLSAYADRCEDKTAERIVVEMPTAHHPKEYAMDRERIFAYVKKRRTFVAQTFGDRFLSLPFLPTMFDRAHARQLRHAVDYYADVRELTPLTLVVRSTPDASFTSVVVRRSNAMRDTPQCSHAS